MSFDTETEKRQLSFTASLLVDGERLATITASTLESLEEKLYKLELAKERITNE